MNELIYICKIDLFFVTSDAAPIFHKKLAHIQEINIL